ncbi:hypothetical protein LWI29_016974 [Acer saccharum]|uniref:Apple domain-containing protein n=1 Tax=Acer saccharum TaxID=4024 RepID=A0AA39T065_ACESA|nr:hypothetical protein LWI29_016974 [Acer saccharum]
MIIDPHGSPQLFLKMGPVIVYRWGSWNGVQWTGSSQPKPNPLYTYNFVSNEKEVFLTYDVQDSSVLSRVALSPSGVVQRWRWMDETHKWLGYYEQMPDECYKYSLCGAYASCNFNNLPICTCFKGFVPKSQQQWSIYNWSAGCIRKTRLDCQHGDGFVKHEAVKLPDTSHSSTVKYISLVQCKKLCIKNCSCMAYATLDIREGGSGCLLWFTDLFDVTNVVGGQDLYVRVAASEADIDVFSFGVLLLEIVSGKKNTGFYQTASLNLLGYAWAMWTSDKGLELKDPVLEKTRRLDVGVQVDDVGCSRRWLDIDYDADVVTKKLRLGRNGRQRQKMGSIWMGGQRIWVRS